MNNTVTLESGHSFTLTDGVYRITKPGDEAPYVLKLHHSRIPEHMFLHYASEGADTSAIAADLVAMAEDAYEAAD